MPSDCGYKKAGETNAQYRRRCGPRPLGMIQRGGKMGGNTFKI